MKQPYQSSNNVVPLMDLARAYLAGLVSTKLRFMRRLSLVFISASCALTVTAITADLGALGTLLTVVSLLTVVLSVAALMFLKATTAVVSNLIEKDDTSLSPELAAALDNLSSLPTGGVGIVWYLIRLRRPGHLAAELERLGALIDAVAPSSFEHQQHATVERPTTDRAVSPVGSASPPSPAGSRTDGLAGIIGTLLFLVLIFGVCFVAMENGPYLSNWPGLLNFLVGALPVVGICFAAFETAKARERDDTIRRRAWLVVAALFTVLIFAALGSTGGAGFSTAEWKRLGTDADIRAADLRMLGLVLGLFVWGPLHIVVGVVRMERRFNRDSGEAPK